jgi:hypothetical protein
VGTYSFMDVQASIVGPGGSFNLGYGSANSEEGISVAMTEDKNTMTIGADGAVMHSLHAGNGGTVTLRYLKTSPTNQMLAAMYDLQRTSSALWGQNTIVVADPARGDMISCTQVAFQRWPNVNYAKDGGVQEWAFQVGAVNGVLGAGS